MWISLLLIVGTHVAAETADYQFDYCPNIKPASSFNIDKWSEGTWYQLYQDTYNHFPTMNVRTCISREHIYDEEAALVISESYAVLLNGTPEWTINAVRVTNTPGLFEYDNLNRSFGHDFGIVELRVTDVEYDSYAVHFLCGFDHKTKKSYISARIYSRTLQVPKGLVKKVTEFFKQHYGMEFRFIPVPFNKCKARCSI